MSQASAQRTDDESGEGATNPKKRPVDTVRVGNVEIPIWRNEGGSTGEFFTASSPTIRYKDGEEWKDGSSYGGLDLLSLAEAAREASAKIRELSKGRRQAR